MAAEHETLEILEDRVKRLEEKKFGLLPKDAEYPEVVSTLATLGGELCTALGTRDWMMMVMQRLQELERYLDPAYGESLEVSDSVRAELVLSREEQMQQQQQQLNTLHSLKHVLDSQHIAGTICSFDFSNNVFPCNFAKNLSLHFSYYQFLFQIPQIFALN